MSFPEIFFVKLAHARATVYAYAVYGPKDGIQSISAYWMPR